MAGLGGDLEYRQDLPASPRRCSARRDPAVSAIPTLAAPVASVSDEVDERGLVSPEAAPLHRGRPIRQAVLKRISPPPGLASHGIFSRPPALGSCVPRRPEGGRSQGASEAGSPSNVNPDAPVVIAERIERIPGLPAACGPIPDDRRDDLVKAGLTSRQQIASCQGFPGLLCPVRQAASDPPGRLAWCDRRRCSARTPKTPERGRSRHAAPSSAAVQYKTPEPMWLRGLVEGSSRRATVARVTDIQRLADSTSHHFIISTFHFIIA
jgi:hypothetical protein